MSTYCSNLSRLQTIHATVVAINIWALNIGLIGVLNVTCQATSDERNSILKKRFQTRFTVNIIKLLRF